MIGAIGVGLFSSVSCANGGENPTAVSSGTDSNIGPGTNTSEQEFPTAPPPSEAQLVGLEVGTAAGVPGEQVTLPIFLRTGDAVVRGVRVNLDYDGNALTYPEGSAGVDLPRRWTFASFSPDPGDLRFLAVDFAGQPFSGQVFTATFTIDAAAAPGEVAVRVALEEVRDDSNLQLSLRVADGVVTVQSPGG